MPYYFFYLCLWLTLLFWSWVLGLQLDTLRVMLPVGIVLLLVQVDSLIHAIQTVGEQERELEEKQELERHKPEYTLRKG